MQTARSAESLLADRLLAAAQSLASGSAEQQAVAGVLFEHAESLSPKDAELVEAALRFAVNAVADDKLADRLTKKLAGLDPNNQRAQVEKLTLETLGEQTVYARIAKVKAMLNPDKRDAYAPQVRAELAARAASWAREANDTESLEWFLRLAIKADPANGLAASLQYAYVASLADAPTQAVDSAALGWMLASPTDPEARLVIADALLKQGCYEAAFDQYQAAAQLLAQSGLALPAGSIRSWAASMIGASKPKDAVALIEQQITSLMPAVSAESAEANQGESSDAQADTRASVAAKMPLDWLILRQIALTGPVISDTQKAAFDDLMAAFDHQAEQSGDDIRLDKAWTAAMLAPDIQQARPLVRGLPSDEPRVVRARGWIAARLGQADVATELFKQIGQSDRSALLGLATLQAPPRQAAFLKAIGQQEPESLVSLYAVHRLYGLKGRSAPTKAGEQLLAIYQRVPTRIRQLNIRSAPWIRVMLEIAPEGIDALGPMEATLNIRNDLTAPMRLGPGGAAPDWMLVEPKITSNGRPVPGLGPVFVPLTHALSIPARGSVSRQIRLDRGVMGDILSTNPWNDWRLAISAYSDPRQAVEQTINGNVAKLVAGPYGSVDTARFSMRPESALDAAVVASLVQSLETDGKAEALARLLPLIQTGAPPVSEQKAAVMALINEGFANSTPIEQAWLLWLLPSQDTESVSFEAVRQLAARSPSGLVRVVHLLKHVDPQDEQSINAAKRHEDPGVVAVATAMAQQAVKAQQTPDTSAANGE